MRYTHPTKPRDCVWRHEGVVISIENDSDVIQNTANNNQHADHGTRVLHNSETQCDIIR